MEENNEKEHALKEKVAEQVMFRSLHQCPCIEFMIDNGLNYTKETGFTEE